MTYAEQFDKAIATVTQERGKNYGHPAKDFENITRLIMALPEYTDPRLKHIAYMICVKLCRLSQDPAHLDSIIDIAGYARTWAMIQDTLPDKTQNVYNNMPGQEYAAHGFQGLTPK